MPLIRGSCIHGEALAEGRVFRRLSALCVALLVLILMSSCDDTRSATPPSPPPASTPDKPILSQEAPQTLVVRISREVDGKPVSLAAFSLKWAGDWTEHTLTHQSTYSQTTLIFTRTITETVPDAYVHFTGAGPWSQDWAHIDKKPFPIGNGLFVSFDSSAFLESAATVPCLVKCAMTNNGSNVESATAISVELAAADGQPKVTVQLPDIIAQDWATERAFLVFSLVKAIIFDPTLSEVFKKISNNAPSHFGIAIPDTPPAAK